MPRAVATGFFIAGVQTGGIAANRLGWLTVKPRFWHKTHASVAGTPQPAPQIERRSREVLTTRPPRWNIHLNRNLEFFEYLLAMFCPKCGSQNLDGSKFCRGCGSDLSNAMAIVGGKGHLGRPQAEKHIELYSQGLRSLIISLGLIIITGILASIPSRTWFLFLCSLAFTFFFLATGVSRLVQARALKTLNSPEVNPTLTPGDADYIRPAQSIYETDDLPRPFSVTERTTRHLKSDER